MLTALPCVLLLAGCLDNAAPVASAPISTAAQAPPQTETAHSEPLSSDEQQSLNEKLLTAAAEGKTELVVSSLESGAYINAQDGRGRTAVMAATHGNHVETVKALIEAGADINRQDDRQDNPFLYAGAEGLVEILKLVIDAGPNTKLYNRYGGTPLIPAGEHGHLEVASELLTRTDVDVNHVNDLGWTALMEAIVLNDGGKRQQEMVQLLIDYGADVNLADFEGKTPLYRAKERGYEEIVRILENAGAR